MARAGLSQVAAAYDGVALTYDDGYASQLDRAEEMIVREVLAEQLPVNDVLDLGCGTGLGYRLVESLCGSTPYVGVDVSEGMIAQALDHHCEAHSAFLAKDMRATQASWNGKFDLVMSLFGSPNYLPFAQVADVAYDCLVPGGKAVLMPFTPARYLRNKPLVASTQTKAVDEYGALKACGDAGFASFDVRGLGSLLLDEVAPWLSLSTLVRALRDLMGQPPRNPIYWIVVAEK